jgi:multiple sugar transport system ATP-binding protein
MRKGRLQQVAPPEELYRRPLNVFVAGFIGSPAMNMLEATVERHDGGLRVTAGETQIELDGDLPSARPGLAAYENRPIVLGIRPENLEDAALADDERPRLRGRSELREALGSETLVHFSVAARQAVTDEVRELAQDVGDDRVLDELASGGSSTATLVGRFDPSTRIREGDTIEVSVDHQALHFFDRDSGLAIM